jgi:hypothetical protein
MAVAVAITTLVASGVGLSACSRPAVAPPLDAPDTSAAIRRDPVITEIAPAVEALETMLGGPQEYVEINADAQIVSLIVFDAITSQAIPYRYLRGEIARVGEPFAISGGQPLRAEWINFDPATMFDALRSEVPEANIVGFVILAGAEGTVTYETFLQSRQGGQILVTLSPDGQVLSVQAL